MGEEKAEAARMFFEDEAYKAGYALIAGVDEVGRGPLAGPVLAAAVILPPRFQGMKGLRDSKKVAAKTREVLYRQIMEQALGVGLAAVSAREIDRLNILKAALLAMKQAVLALSPPPQFLLVDGHLEVPLELPQQAIVKGDDRSLSIAAASIIAKVSRDRHMHQLDALYPQYGFAQHKGYGTAAHREALGRHGPCPEHRLSFKGVGPDLHPNLFPHHDGRNSKTKIRP